MRTLFLCLLFCALIDRAYCNDTTPLQDTQPSFAIEKINTESKAAYVIIVGYFSNKNTALQQKLKLSSQYHQQVTIDYIDLKKEYLVKIGPVDNLTQAQVIRAQLQPNSATSNTSNQIETPKQEANVENESAETTHQPKLWNLNNADVRAVIAEVSRVTGKNFIIDPRVQGKISIVSTTAMNNKELYRVFLSMLQVSGFAAIPTGSVIKIVPNIDSKFVTGDSRIGLNTGVSGDAMLVDVIPVRYVPAEQLVPVLRPLMPQWSNISAYVPSNMLILSGRASNIKQLAAIIKQVDSSSAYGIDVVPLKHALAMDIAATLKDLVKPQGNSNSRLPTMISADDRSNALLVSGDRMERIRLRMIINKLDRQNSDNHNSNTQVIYLNYLRAEDLAPILAGIAQANFSGNVGTTIGTVTHPILDSTNPASNLSANSNATNSSSGVNSGVQPSALNTAATANTSSASTQNEGSTKPNVQIIAEPNTNSIILNAPATLIRILKTVINQLDIKPAQILIEALVTEVNESDITQLGIEWGSNLQTGHPSAFTNGFAIINSKTAISDFQAQLYALTQQRRANILSTPSVVVLDNRQAKILVGKQVSVASTTYPNNGNGTAPASPYVTFDRVNVALHLYVRPQITRGRGIQLQIDQGNDTLDPSNTANTENPAFNISSIVTSVHVESGDIIVLGGLIQDSLGNDDNRLPILGDIPGIGKLFQKNARNRQKRVLMVFIKPAILKSEHDSYQVTGAKYNDIRQYQLEWLRNQEYNKNNNAMILPALKKTLLPKPFGMVAPARPGAMKQ